MNREKYLGRIWNLILLIIILNYFLHFLDNFIHFNFLETYFDYVNRNHIILYTYDFIMIVSLLFVYAKFLNMMERNSYNKSDYRWLLKFTNFRLILKISDLTIPFVLLKCANYYFALESYISSPYQQAISGVVLPYLAVGIFCSTTLVILYFVSKILVNKQWVKVDSIELKFLAEHPINETNILDSIIIMGEITVEFNEKIQHFFAHLKGDFLIRYVEKRTMHIVNNKKANTPPNN